MRDWEVAAAPGAANDASYHFRNQAAPARPHRTARPTVGTNLLADSHPYIGEEKVEAICEIHVARQKDPDLADVRILKGKRRILLGSEVYTSDLAVWLVCALYMPMLYRPE